MTCILGGDSRILVADPEYFLFFPLTAGVPVGQTFVVQSYAVDPARSWPDSLVITPPAMLSF